MTDIMYIFDNEHEGEFTARIEPVSSFNGIPYIKLSLYKEAIEALENCKLAMLNHAGWNLNHDKDGKELPMTRPKDVQEADIKAKLVLTKSRELL